MLFVKLLAMEDQTITAGQVIVRGGAGQGIGPRLHLEVSQNDAPLNPENYL